MSNATSWYQPTEIATPTIEFAIFEIAGVSFGLPISKIDRIIIHTSSGEASSRPPDIAILNLHHQIFGISALADPAAYTIVWRDKQELCMIPVDTVPVLTAVIIDRIRTIPSDLRATNPLGIASHVAIISTPTGELTVFILDI